MASLPIIEVSFGWQYKEDDPKTIRLFCFIGERMHALGDIIIKDNMPKEEIEGILKKICSFKPEIKFEFKFDEQSN
jgi:hypothetical protein